MSKEERYKLDGISFIDTKTDMCLNLGKKDLIRVCVYLNNQEEFLNDYERQLAELKAESEMLKENNKSKLMELFNFENKKLQQQLKEKDEQLEHWQQLAVTQNGALTSEGLQQILQTNTKQVCNKIRQAICECDFVNKDGFYYIKQIELNDKVDEIEN